MLMNDEVKRCKKWGSLRMACSLVVAVVPFAG